MAYKTKICPKCQTEHNKRGQFCSRSCGNSRIHTNDHKARTAEGLRKWHKESDVAAVTAHNFINKGKNKESEPIPPQLQKNIANNQFVDGGDLWTIDE